MKKYNYFDDEVEYEDTPDDSSAKEANTPDKAKRDIKVFLNKIKSGEFVRKFNDDDDYRRKATVIICLVTALIALLCFIISFSHTINSQNKRNDKFCEDAGKVCVDYIKEYGAIKWESLERSVYGENQARLTGLCYARQMDFNNDSSDELMLCYNQNNVYYLEVWGYDGKEFVRYYSEEANSTNDDKDGSWVGFYHKNNRYYICKSKKESPEKVTLYALKGVKFKPTSKKIAYDYKDNIYSVNGKINYNDFETIKLSVFRKSKGDVYVDIVTNNIDSFGNILSKAIVNQKSDAQLKAEAYYEIIEKRNEKYGKASVKTENDVTFIDGVGIVRLIDFDGDGNEELLVAYRKYKNVSKYDNYSGDYIYYDVPIYNVDVYNWNGAAAKRIFSKNSVSNFLDDENVFYLLLKSGKKTVNICNNVYSFENSYCYTASSKVYKLKKEKFEPIYNAKLINEYGYRRYYIDNESVYSSTFEEKGHEVPFFLNDDATYDKSKYTAIFLSGKDEDKFDATVKDTVETIKKINPYYTETEK